MTIRVSFFSHWDELLNMVVGGDLAIESQKDTHSRFSKGFNVSAGFGLGSGGNVSSLSAGYGANNGRTKQKETLLSSVTGKAVNLYVAKNTNLKGSLLAAGEKQEDGTFVDNGNLHVKTDTLTYTNTSNTLYNSDNSFNVNTTIGLSGNTKEATPNTTANAKLGTVNASFSMDKTYEKTKTLATLGQGTLEVTDKENSDDLDRLNRETGKVEKEFYAVTQSAGADMTLDTRLLTEDGRKQIKEDAKEIENAIAPLKEIIVLSAEILDINRKINQLGSDDPALRKETAQEFTNMILTANAADPGALALKEKMVSQIGDLAEKSGEQAAEVLAFLNQKPNQAKQELFPVIIPVVLFLLEAVDKGIIAYDAYQIAKAVDEGDYDKAGSLAGEYGLELAAETTIGSVIPGSMLGIKLGKGLKNVVIKGDKAKDAAQAISKGTGKVAEKAAKNTNLDWDAIIPKKGKYKGQTRPDHVRLHNVDVPDKPAHGVFFDDGVDVTNEAWARAQQMGIKPDSTGKLTVPMDKQVGWMGGKAGEAAIPMDSVTIIVKPGTNKVITAYPDVF